jgi:hypothetical protein
LVVVATVNSAVDFKIQIIDKFLTMRQDVNKSASLLMMIIILLDLIDCFRHLVLFISNNPNQ